MTMTKHGRFLRNLAWTLTALAIIDGVVIGIIAAVIASTHHHDTQVRHAIADCEDNGGTYLYANHQLVRLTWTISGYPNYGRDGRYAPYHPHTDYVVTDVPHAGGGMCLTPEDRAVGR